MDKDAKQILGDNVRKYRLQSGLSFRKLALEADCEVSQIQLLEKGKSNITINTLFQIAKALNLPPAKLLEE